MIVGTIDRAAERIRDFEHAGADRIMFQDLLPRDLDLAARSRQAGSRVRGRMTEAVGLGGDSDQAARRATMLRRT